MSAYRSTYGIARAIARVIAGIGYLTCFLAVCYVILGFAILSGAQPKSPELAQAFILLCGSAGAIFAGILVVGVSQFMRAAIDTADFTGEMLTIMRERPSI